MNIDKDIEVDEKTMHNITGGLIDLFVALNKDAVDEYQRGCDVSFCVADKVEINDQIVFDLRVCSDKQESEE